MMRIRKPRGLALALALALAQYVVCEKVMACRLVRARPYLVMSLNRRLRIKRIAAAPARPVLKLRNWYTRIFILPTPWLPKNQAPRL